MRLSLSLSFSQILFDTVIEFPYKHMFPQMTAGIDRSCLRHLYTDHFKYVRLHIHFIHSPRGK